MKATCEQCEKPAMYVPDAEDAERAFLNSDVGIPIRRVVLKCAYCGNEQRSGDIGEITHAYHYGDDQRRFYARVLAQEREKVERLREGRW